MGISEIIMSWYNLNKRDLPWRQTNDPYLIWISEIILQQTRINQGRHYYLRFVHRFPDIHHLAAASIDEVLKYWEGLGYYSRARNLYESAQRIEQHYSGKMPLNYADLLKLKGIGTYTAAAIASIAYNEPVALVDGNVYRVLSRMFLIETPIDTNAGKKEFQHLADEMLDKRNPGVHNQALMEFGSLQCSIGMPNCSLCPLNHLCLAFKENKQLLFPQKSKRQEKKIVYIHYLIFQHNGSTIIRRREGKGIWKYLYEFPSITSENMMEPLQVMKSQEFVNLTKGSIIKINSISGEIKHELTHIRILARFYHIYHESELPLSDVGYLKIEIPHIQDYAFPRIITRYLENNSLYEWMKTIK
jgi:A/G-specific adenine glycosylase